MRLTRAYINTFLCIPIMMLITALAVDHDSIGDKLFDIKYTELTKEARVQVDCLTQNIYHEAGHEPEDGKIAVAMVTLNRLQDPRYPKDICSVVKQRTARVCQFSWFCNIPKLYVASDTYVSSQKAALHVYANYENLEDITRGALFYHADYVNPRWKLNRTIVIGRHIFYKESDI